MINPLSWNFQVQKKKKKVSILPTKLLWTNSFAISPAFGFMNDNYYFIFHSFTRVSWLLKNTIWKFNLLKCLCAIPFSEDKRSRRWSFRTNYVLQQNFEGFKWFLPEVGTSFPASWDTSKEARVCLISKFISNINVSGFSCYYLLGKPCFWMLSNCHFLS